MAYLILCVSLLLVFLIYDYFKRRKLYEIVEKIPGPRLYPIIGSPILVKTSDDFAQIMHKFVKSYGTTIRVWLFRSLYVMVSEPRHLKIVLNHPDCLERDVNYRFIKDATGDGLISAPVQIWKTHRKIINPTFNKKILDSFFDTFVKYSDIFVKQLEKEVDKDDFDVDHYMGKCSFNIVCETTLGVGENDTNYAENYFEIAVRIMDLAVKRLLTVWLHPRIIFKHTSVGREFYKIVDDWFSFTGKIVSKRREEFNNNNYYEFDDEVRRPFLDHLLTVGKDFSFEDLRNEVGVLITGGSDTTTACVGNVLVCLGMYPDVQEKLVEELDSIFGKTHRPIAPDDIPKLIYLERVIKETMRLFPAVVQVARTVTKDVDLGDYTLPAGTSLIVGIIAAHRNPEIWPDPLKFDPDRFLPEEVAKRDPYSYLPFSKGPRDCVGKNFGMLELKVLLTTVLRKYKIGTNIKQKDVRLKVAMISRMEGGCKINITRR